MRSPKEAIAWAAYQSRYSTYNWYRQCLKFARSCYGVAAKYATAGEAYAHTRYRHTSWPPPAGALVWWTKIGQAGHVALSDGKGNCWSTDIRRVGKVDLVPIVTIERSWGIKYRGWTEDINDVRVWSPPQVVPAQPASGWATFHANGSAHGVLPTLDEAIAHVKDMAFKEGGASLRRTT